ncbi:hypothetical protein, partial [Arcobacter sp. F2176]|uniref:hypothetical protein n=1 Tax=Arcobacter sp. F2176 TaxID=2044511 RepID=UPI0010258CD3
MEMKIITNYQTINLNAEKITNGYYELRNKKFIVVDTAIDKNSFFNNIVNIIENEKIIKFKECIFSKNFYLPSISFTDKFRKNITLNELIFESCVFENEVIIENKQIDCQLIFNNCIFKSSLNLRNSVFSSYCDFSRSIIIGKINLELTSFDDIVNFKDVLMDKTN